MCAFTQRAFMGSGAGTFRASAKSLKFPAIPFPKDLIRGLSIGAKGI